MRISGSSIRKPEIPPVSVMPNWPPSFTLPAPKEIVVPPAEVTVQVPEGQAPQVTVIVEKQKGWHFKIIRDNRGQLTDVIATPME